MINKLPSELLYIVVNHLENDKYKLYRTKTKMINSIHIRLFLYDDVYSVETFAVLCAAMGHKCIFTGLQTLKIKVTDRISALKTELKKLGADFIEEDNKWTVIPILAKNLLSAEEVVINTYNDHRMAMAFAPLATKTSLIIDDAAVVNKSYPTFWQDLERIGFNLRR